MVLSMVNGLMISWGLLYVGTMISFRAGEKMHITNSTYLFPSFDNSFDNSAEANDNTTHPHGKSLLGKKEPN